MNRRILVIDDEAPIRSALGQLLEYEGYEVRTVSNGPEGLTEYDRFRPHLVFSDVKMAGMDGLDVLRALRAKDSRALVVMISGHATLATAVARRIARDEKQRRDQRNRWDEAEDAHRTMLPFAAAICDRARSVLS